MSWESWVFPLQYQDFLHLKSNFSHLKSDFLYTKSNLPQSAFYFLLQLSTFFNSFLTFFNGFRLSPMAFQNFPMAFWFSSTAYHFPRNQRKSIYGDKYTKDCYLSFVFFATRSTSFVVPIKQYLHLTQEPPPLSIIGNFFNMKWQNPSTELEEGLRWSPFLRNLVVVWGGQGRLLCLAQVTGKSG